MPRFVYKHIVYFWCQVFDCLPCMKYNSNHNKNFNDMCAVSLMHLFAHYIGFLGNYADDASFT